MSNFNGIIEVSYFNSYWVKRIGTGDLCTEVTETGQGGNSFVVTNTKGNFTWPGPIDFGDAEQSDSVPTNNSSSCIGYEPGNTPDPTFVSQNYYIEESRIRGGFNNVATDLGVKAYLNEKNPLQKTRPNALIYSGPFNSNTNFNETNVFPVGDAITKALDPHNGSIQKLYAEDTNLIVCQEDKISRALIDKDAIFSAEGGGSVTSTNLVIGQIVPYVGDYGISKNPESFAVYGFRKYFTDTSRNAVMRLSRDGLTEISNYGMVDWFRDSFSTYKDKLNYKEFLFTLSVGGNFNPNSPNVVSVIANQVADLINIGSVVGYSDGNANFSTIGTVANVTENQGLYTITFSNPLPTSVTNGDQVKITSFTKPRIIGGWDIYTKQYQLSLQQGDSYFVENQGEESYSTLAFDESVLGWTSYFSYNPEWCGSLKNKYYSAYCGKLYEHNVNSGNNRSTFYGVRTPSRVTFVFNPQPDLSKNFLTVNYEGTSGWQCNTFESDLQEKDNFVDNTGYNFTIYNSYKDSIIPIKSYIDGAYDSTPAPAGPRYGINIQTPPIYRSGFDRKENLYVASLRNNSATRPNEIQFSSINDNEHTAGVKANYATVTFSVDDVTDVGGMKELFAVSTTFSKSGF